MCCSFLEIGLAHRHKPAQGPHVYARHVSRPVPTLKCGMGRQIPTLNAYLLPRMRQRRHTQHTPTTHTHRRAADPTPSRESRLPGARRRAAAAQQPAARKATARPREVTGLQAVGRQAAGLASAARQGAVTPSELAACRAPPALP